MRVRLTAVTPSRYFLDTEFIEDGKTIDLISIGIVCDDGREYYAEVDSVPWEKADPWVVANVRPHLLGGEAERPMARIATDIVAFVTGSKKEFWGYYCDYDWVVLCRLYGRMIDLPSGWPMFCMDVKQEAVRQGSPKLPKQSSTEHHALHDARWTRDAWSFLVGRESDRLTAVTTPPPLIGSIPEKPAQLLDDEEVEAMVAEREKEESDADSDR